MNTKDEAQAGVVAEEPKSAEEVAAEEAEAEKAFAAGVAKTTGVEEKAPAASESKDDTDTDADATAKAAAEAKAKEESDAKAKTEAEAKAKVDAEALAKDEAADNALPSAVRAKLDSIDGIKAGLDKVASHVGGFKRTLDELAATGKAAAEKKDAPAPTKLEIAEAMSDPDKWKQLQSDFPEWMGPIASELTRLRKEVAEVAKVSQREQPAAPAAKAAEVVPIDTAAIVAEAEERAVVRMKHPDWKAICASPDFAKKDAEGKIIGGWLSQQTAELKAKAESDSADDAIALFDAYKAHRQKIADAETKRLKNEKRLQAAVPAKGSEEPPQTGLSDDEAFDAGVKKALRRK